MVTIDDHMAAIAARAPAFGGAFYDSSGALIVLATSGSDRALLVSVLRDYAREWRIALVDAAITVREARHSFATLQQRYLALIASLPRHGITQTRIDMRNNRVVIGVRDSASLRSLEAVARSQGLLDPLVAFEIRQPVTITSVVTDSVRPTVGGLYVNAPGGCTLGANVRMFWDNPFGFYAAGEYFITNSHCTAHRDSLTYDAVYQPVPALVGTEAVDPPTFTSAANTRCPPGRRCRFSDAALVAYHSGILNTFGSIARLGPGTPGQYPLIGSYTITAEGWGV